MGDKDWTGHLRGLMAAPSGPQTKRREGGKKSYDGRLAICPGPGSTTRFPSYKKGDKTLGWKQGLAFSQGPRQHQLQQGRQEEIMMGDKDW